MVSLEKDQKKLGPYTLLRRLAVGGMADIWLAERKGISGFSKRLVIKTILEYLSDDPELVEMFLGEGRIAAGLNHPNIAHIYDLGEIDETYFLSMEYVHGRDLRYWMAAGLEGETVIPLKLILRITAEACAGLHYAHTWKTPDGKPAGIIHRDVSPDNILVTFDGSVKIVDFGVAKAFHTAKTKTGVLKGKYAYMSPEQVSGEKLDRRSDLFSLGVVVYELITGMRLFKRESEIDTLEAVSTAQVPPLADLGVQVPGEVESILMRVLNREPELRFESAREMQQAIEKAMVRLRLVCSTTDLSAFMHELFDEEEELDRKMSAELGRSLESFPDVTGSEPGPERTKAIRPKIGDADVSGPSGTVEVSQDDLRATLDERKPIAILKERYDLPADEPPISPGPERAGGGDRPRRFPRWAAIGLLPVAAACAWVAASLFFSPPSPDSGGAGDIRPAATAPATLPSPPAPPPVEPKDPIPPPPPPEEKEEVEEKEEQPASVEPVGKKKNVKKGLKKRRGKTRKEKPWCEKKYGRGFGFVDVGCLVKWAVVYIDGEKIRYTPLVKYRLWAGQHAVELKDQQGKTIRRWCIRLRSNQHIKLIHQ